MKPCTFEIEGKRLNYDQMRELLLDRPDLVEIGMEVKNAEKAPTKEQPPVAPKKRAPKQLKFTSDEDAQAFLDEVGIDPDNLPALLLPFGSRQGKNVAKAVNKMMEADRIEDFIDEEDKGLMKDVSRLKSAIEEARKENPKEFLQGLIDRAEAALKERTRPGTMNDFVKVALDGLLQAYIGILKAAQAAGRYISRKQAMAEARASLKGKHSETDLEMAVRELERREGERIRNAIKKAAGVRNVKDRVQAAIDKAFAVGMGYGKQEGFQKGATAGGRAGFATGQEEGFKTGFQKGATAGGKAGFKTGQEEGFKTGFQKGATAGGKAGFKTGQEEGFKTGYVSGATAGMKAGDVSGRQTVVRMLKVALQELKADLNPRQINGLLTRMERIKNMTPEAKERFSDYAEKVVENANYVLQERAATKLQGRVRAMAESAATPAGDKALYAGFSDLSIAHMEPDVLSEYLNWAEKIVGKKLTKGDRELLSDFTSRQSKVQTRIKEGRAAKARATREQNQRDEYDRLKKEGELPEGVTTFEEYVESTKTSRPAKDRLGMVKERLANLVAPEGADPKDVEVVGQFKKADLSLLSDADLDFLDNALYEFEDNGNLSGVGRLLSKIKGLEGVAKAEPTRRLVEKKDADKYTVTQLFNALWRGRLGSNAARAALIQPALSAFGKGHIVYEKERLELARLAKELKLTGENWNRIDLFGFLNEAEDNPELFEKLKNQKLSDLARLKEEVAAYQPTSFVGKAVKFLRPNEVVKALEERLTNLDAAVKSMGLTTESTLEDVKANLTQNEKRLYDKLRETLDKYSPEAMRNIRLYGNRDLGYIKNYWPRMAHRMDGSEQLLPDELEDFGLYENDKMGKDLFGRQKGRTKLLGKSGVYETSGRVNFFNGLREMILIGEAADEYAQMQAVYNDKRGFDSLVKDKGFGGAKQVKELLVSYIRDLKAYGRYATDVRSVAKYAVDTAQKNLTGALLKNPTQALKQPTALAYTASQSPTAFAKAMEIFVRPKYAQAVSQLTHYSTLPFREMLPEITRMSELMDSDSSPLIDKIKTARAFINKYTGSNVITDTDKMVSAVSMLTGYIQHQVESGAIKKASDFDLEAEAEKGFDITAIAAGETLQAEANNENTRVLFSNKQKNAQGAYFLMNFTRNATMNLYNNIGKVFRPDATRTERIEGLQGILGYAGSAYLFNLAAQASALLVKQAFLSMFGDDDDEEKMKAYDEATALSRRDGLLYKEIQNVVAGTQPIWAQMAAQAAAAALFEQWQRNQQKKVREGEAEETERTKKEYRPLFQPETPGIAGVAVEELEALAQPVFQGDEEAIMNQLLLTMAKTTGFEALSWLKQNKMRFDKRVKKAEKFGDETFREAAEKALAPPDKKLIAGISKALIEGDEEKASRLFDRAADKKAVAIQAADAIIQKDVSINLGPNRDNIIITALTGKDAPIMVNGRTTTVKKAIPPSSLQYIKVQFEKLREQKKKSAALLKKLSGVPNIDAYILSANAQ